MNFKKRKFNTKSDLNSNLLLQKYSPNSIAELGIHKNKISDVKNWIFGNAFDSKPKILALTGHSGVGKTALINVLSKEMGFEILEFSFFVNEFLFESFSSTKNNNSTEFVDFVHSCIKSPKLSSDPAVKSVALIEEFPNCQIPHVRKQVHEAFLTYLNSKNATRIIILIISDVSSISTDSWNAPVTFTTLLPKEIHTSPQFHHIRFNLVAKTILLKVLKRVVEIESIGHKNIVTKSKLEEIVACSGGDIRSAFQYLEFVMNGGELDMECLYKDDSPNLFKSIGKVLYNKREETMSECEHQLNDFYLKRKKMAFEPESLMDLADTFEDNYLLFLAENYPYFNQEIDEIAGAFDYLSVANQLSSIKSEENSYYACSIGIRGCMFVFGDSIDHQARSFRALSKPKYWENIQTRRNCYESTIDQLYFQSINSTINKSDLFSITNRVSIQNFLGEIVPFLVLILQTMNQKFRISDYMQHHLISMNTFKQLNQKVEFKENDTMEELIIFNENSSNNWDTQIDIKQNDNFTRWDSALSDDPIED